MSLLIAPARNGERRYRSGMTKRIVRVWGGLALAGAVVLTGCGGSAEEEVEVAASASASVIAAPGPASLLAQQEITVVDQRIAYPTKGVAQISSDITVLEPGQETGWLRNRVPVYVYVLEGTLTVEFDAAVTREFAAGTAFVQAVKADYNGINKGTTPVRMLTVAMGSKGVKTTVPR